MQVWDKIPSKFRALENIFIYPVAHPAIREAMF